MAKSNLIERPAKPAGHPCFPHRNGYWAKKVRGKLVYFSRWDGDDPRGDEAKRIWQRDGEALKAGRVPRPDAESPTVGNLLYEYASEKKKARDAGELSNRTYLDSIRVCDTIRDHFGESRPLDDIRAADFTALHEKFRKRRWNPTTIKTQVTKVKSVFNFAFQSELTDHPFRFGPVFKSPSAKSVREAKHRKGSRVFTPEEIHKLLEHASAHMRAMVLLGVNCCFGNGDIGNLTKSALNLDEGWVEFPRPKTAVMRRIPLWPKTVAALRESLTQRRKHKSRADADIVFITTAGERFDKNTSASTLSQEFRRLLERAGIYRPGLGFYSLRHTAATVADESRDPNAVKALLGHLESGVTSHYKHGLSDERMKAVTDCIHAWLFGQK